MISILFLILAAACDAVMDTCVQHYSNSIFSNLGNQKWWDGSISWTNKYVDGDPSKGLRKLFWNIPYPVQLTDSFHFFKMWMIVFICVSIAFHDIPLEIPNLGMFSFPVMIFILGCVWNSTFSLFYNRILIKKGSL